MIEFEVIITSNKTGGASFETPPVFVCVSCIPGGLWWSIRSTRDTDFYLIHGFR